MHQHGKNKKWLSFIAWLLVVPVFATSVAKASDDETAMGTYSYVGQGIRIRFVLDLDGVRKLRIDGKLFGGPIQVDEGGDGEDRTYTFSVTDDGIVKTVRLVVLFDTDGAVKAISGSYEHKGGAETMTHVVTIRPSFRRIHTDELPSAKP